MDPQLIANALQNIAGPFELYFASTPISDLTTNEYNAIILGVAHGIVQGEDLTEVEACLGEVKTEATSAYNAFEDLLHHHWQTGIKDLGAIAYELPDLVQDCTHLSDDIATLKSWATAFSSISDVENTIKTNVTHNLIKLTRDLNKAKNDYKNEEYYTFGTQLGEMLVIATQPLSELY